MKHSETNVMGESKSNCIVNTDADHPAYYWKVDNDCFIWNLELIFKHK